MCVRGNAGSIDFPSMYLELEKHMSFGYGKTYLELSILYRFRTPRAKSSEDQRQGCEMPAFVLACK